MAFNADTIAAATAAAQAAAPKLDPALVDLIVEEGMARELIRAGQRADATLFINRAMKEARISAMRAAQAVFAARQTEASFKYAPVAPDKTAFPDVVVAFDAVAVKG